MHNNFGTTQLIPLNTASSQSKTPCLKKYATLSPYISEIERRKKTKSLIRENRSKSRNKHQISSKSFRIKEKSTTSLHDNSQTKQKRDQSIKYILELVSKANPPKKNHELNIQIKKNTNKQFKSNTKFGGKTYGSSGLQLQTQKFHISKDLDDQQFKFTRNVNREGSVNKNRKRQKRQTSFRKNKYQSKSRIDEISNLSKEKATIQLCKYGYTDFNANKKPDSTVQLKKTVPPQVQEKKKFRRNKYQALYSSVNSNEVRQEKNKCHNDPIKSQSRFDLVKKDSNISLNKQMDILEENEIKKFYRQMRSKQIQRSVQKSTQKYFKQQSSYRTLKSNNDIQIYISTVKNPSTLLNRKSNASTLNTSDQNSMPQKGIQNNDALEKLSSTILNYQFDFKENDGPQFSGIMQIDNPSEEQSSMHFLEQQTSFQRQRKQVQKQFFHKQSPQIQWSDQDCQIDVL